MPAAASLVAAIGPVVVKMTDGKAVAIPTEKALESAKYTALYFSAHVRVSFLPAAARNEASLL